MCVRWRCAAPDVSTPTTTVAVAITTAGEALFPEGLRRRTPAERPLTSVLATRGLRVAEVRTRRLDSGPCMFGPPGSGPMGIEYYRIRRRRSRRGGLSIGRL
ncbi:hypothetical protein E143388_08250 [Rhodococcus opacus]|nr:hypothetical protein E143388_08250 [Rhodococcus opacus]